MPVYSFKPAAVLYGDVIPKYGIVPYKGHNPSACGQDACSGWSREIHPVVKGRASGDWVCSHAIGGTQLCVRQRVPEEQAQKGSSFVREKIVPGKKPIWSHFAAIRDHHHRGGSVASKIGHDHLKIGAWFQWEKHAGYVWNEKRGPALERVA
jgi:hypothetical protein